MRSRLWQLAGLFLKLGATSFGGPAAYIAIMEHETVERRGWLSPSHFLDLVGATYLIPGPNAVEMASHIGYQRAGVLGSLVAGGSFTLPAVLVSLALAWGYVTYGALPQVEPFLLGIKPVVLGIIFAAVWRLGRAGLRTWRLVLIGAAVAVVSYQFGHDVLVLIVGALAGAVFLRIGRRRGPQSAPDGVEGDCRADGDSSAGGGGSAAGAVAGPLVLGSARLGPGTAPLAAGAGASAAAGAAAASGAGASGVALWKLGLFFLKVGALLYGGGYVLVAYMEDGLVSQYGWLTKQQLLDAVAIGQITPGPMLSTVTFVGYMTAGVAGAAVATVAILLPSFFFVAAANPWIPRLRRSRTASLLLDAVSAAAIGLVVAVLLSLGEATLLDLPSWLLAVAAAAVMLRWRIAPAWLVLAGAVLGRVFW